MMLNVYLQSVWDIAHGIHNIHTKVKYLYGNLGAETVMVTPTGQAVLLGLAGCRLQS